MAVVAWIGLGHMGGPMTATLVEAGHALRGFDLSPDALTAADARPFITPVAANIIATGAATTTSPHLHHLAHKGIGLAVAAARGPTPRWSWGSMSTRCASRSSTPARAARTAP